MTDAPACPACEQPVASDAKFCPNCGTALTGRVEERRVATVLFADVVGYTALAESRDPEQVKAIVDRCFERLVAEIGEFGGTVDKIIGDAIVALFGAPVAHEDDAERAVRAALRLQETVTTEFGDGDEPLRLRIGVNTGEVVVGALRAGGEYTAMGDAVNVAQRLQSAARPGMVLVGPTTYAATSEVIRYQDYGTVEARNREEPIEAWIASAAVAPPGRRPRRTRTPFVGREAELAVADGLIRLAAERSRAQVLVVHGETGVGKGRLVQEAAAHAANAYGALVLEGRCVPYGESNQWWPVAEALRYGLGLNHPSINDGDGTGLRARVGEVLGLADDDDEVVRTTDGLCVALGLDSPLDDIDPGRARDEVARALLVLFGALARNRMLIVVLHDLHWADEPVLLVTKALVRRLSTERFVLVATTRRMDADGLTGTVVPHSVASLQLDPLDRDAAGALLDALVGSMDEQRREQLLDRSAGNPYFLEELATLVGSGDDGSSLPENLRGLVLARLDRLEADERALIDNAAVLGSSGSVAALSRFAEGLGQRFDHGALHRLVAKDLFELDGSRWSFRSESVREVAYATLTKAARAERHLGIARSMSRMDPDGRVTADQIAHHLASAAELAAEIGPAASLPVGIAMEAVAWLSQVADRHIRHDEPDQALRVVERARHLGSADTPHCLDLELAAGWALSIKRRLHDAESVAEAVLGEAGDDDGVRGRALTLLAEVAQHRGALVQSDELAGRAAVMLENAGDTAGTAKALRVQGMTNLYSFDVERAGSTLGRARSLSESINDRRGVAWADQHIAWLAFVQGDTQRADERIDAAIATFKELGDSGGRQWGLGLRAWVRFQQGRFDEAMALADAIVAEGENLGDQWALGMMILLKADLSLWMGRSHQAVELASEARSILAGIEDAFGQALAMAPLIRGQLAVGDPDGARRSLEELESLSGREGPPMLAQTLRLGAAVHAGLGDRVPDDTIAMVAGLDEAPVAYEAMVLAGFARLQAGDLDMALLFAERAEAMRSPEHPFVGGLRALLDGATGQHRSAIEVATRVLGRADATYLDRITALVARAAAHCVAEDLAAADADAVEALAVADETDDVVARLLARLAAQVVLECSGSDTSEVRSRVADLQAAAGTDGAGWARALALITEHQ